MKFTVRDKDLPAANFHHGAFPNHVLLEMLDSKVNLVEVDSSPSVSFSIIASAFHSTVAGLSYPSFTSAG